MDIIKIEELEIFAYHGVFAEEKREGQKFYVNGKFTVSFDKAAAADELEYAVDYGKICEKIKEVMTGDVFDLIETAAVKTAKEILISFPMLESAEIEVRKPSAPIPMKFSSVSVVTKKKWHRAVISFGANQGDPRGQIKEALSLMEANSEFRNMKISSFYRSTPYGGVKQDEFVNGVCIAETLLSPRELLHYLKSLEEHAKRERTVRWGPRTLDLDIIYMDQLIIEEEDLVIPHIDMVNRDFVLLPLEEVGYYLRHPVTGKYPREMIKELKEEHVIKRG